MTIEGALLISGVSLAFSIYMGITNYKRNVKSDAKKETSEAKTEASKMTEVIVKLETISTYLVEMKSELMSVKKDVKEDRELIIRVDESVKQAHKRIEACEKYYKRYIEEE